MKNFRPVYITLSPLSFLKSFWCILSTKKRKNHCHHKPTMQYRWLGCSNGRFAKTSLSPDINFEDLLVLYIFFSKIFLKRNYSTCLAFLLHGTSTFHKIFIILTTCLEPIGARCGRRDNLSMSTVQRENYCRDKWSVSLHWSQQNPFVSLIYLNCTFILVGSEDIFIHNFYKMSK